MMRIKGGKEASREFVVDKRDGEVEREEDGICYMGIDHAQRSSNLVKFWYEMRHYTKIYFIFFKYIIQPPRAGDCPIPFVTITPHRGSSTSHALNASSSGAGARYS